MGLANGADPSLGQAEIPHLAFGNKILHRARNIRHRHGWIDTVLIQQVDMVGPEALQHALGGSLDMLGPAVERTEPLAGHEIDVVAKLGRYHDTLAQWLQRLADEGLVLERPISFRCVKEGHAALHGGADKFDHRRMVWRLSVATGHGHAPETDFGDFEALAAKLSRLHCCDSFNYCVEAGSAGILRIGYLFHPIDVFAVEPFGNSDVRHRGRRRRAVPVLFFWREPDDIARMDFFNRAALALNPTDAGGDDDGLAEWMGVPHGASAGLEGDVTAADARGLP